MRLQFWASRRGRIAAYVLVLLTYGAAIAIEYFFLIRKRALTVETSSVRRKDSNRSWHISGQVHHHHFAD
jgi:hypothetical protein